MLDKPVFIKQHSSDGDKLINLHHIVQIKLSDDGYHASVLTVNDSKWIRVAVFYEKLLAMIDVK